MLSVICLFSKVDEMMAAASICSLSGTIYSEQTTQNPILSQQTGVTCAKTNLWDMPIVHIAQKRAKNKCPVSGIISSDEDI